MHRLALVLVLALITLSWDAPATYMNGKPITEPLGYKVHCGYDQHLGAGSTAYDLHMDAGSTLSYPISNDLTGAGDYRCAATAYVVGTDRESGHSTETSFFFSGALPGAPINLKVGF